MKGSALADACRAGPDVFLPAANFIQPWENIISAAISNSSNRQGYRP